MKKSKALGIGLGIFFTIILIVGLLIFYSYTQISITLNDVTYHSIDWTDFSFLTLLKLGLNVLSGNWLSAAFDLVDGINLNLFFGITNNGFLPVYIPDLTYDLLVNGFPVGKGTTPIEQIILPGQTREVKSFQNFKKSSLSPAVLSIVGNEGIMELRVKGTAHLKVFGFTIPIPFESSKQISVYDEIKQKLIGETAKNQKQSTSITLRVPNSEVYSGSSVYLSGKLTAGGSPLSNAVVHIKDEDALSGDEEIKTLRTDSAGNFGFTWIAKSMDSFDNVVELYAVYEGSSTFDSARSKQYNVSVITQSPQIIKTPEIIVPKTTFKSTNLSFSISSTSVSKGDAVVFSGRLVDSSGVGVANALIYLKDEDAGSGDDDIGNLRTNSKGEFRGEWNARAMDPFDSVVELYAVFEGSANFGESRSVQINLRVN